MQAVVRIVLSVVLASAFLPLPAFADEVSSVEAIGSSSDEAIKTVGAAGGLEADASEPTEAAEVAEAADDTEVVPALALPEDEEAYVADELIVVLDDAALSRGQTEAAVDTVITDVSEVAEVHEAEYVVAPEEPSDTVLVLNLGEGADLEEAAAAIASSPEVAYVQPNYLYHLVDEYAISPETDEACWSDAAEVGVRGPGPGRDQDQEQGQEQTGLSAAAIEPQSAANDANIGNRQYYLSAFDSAGGGYGANVLEAWDLARCEGNVTVAVLDTGIIPDHEDLTANILHEYMWDAYNETVLAGDYHTSTHGTHVAGIVAATANNSLGIAGVSYNAKILPIKIFNESTNEADSASICRAYQRLFQLVDAGSVANLRIVNLSIGGYGYYSGYGVGRVKDDPTDPDDDYDPMVKEIIEKARNQYGIVTVCSGGNGDISNSRAYTSPVFPGDLEACVSVTALTTAGANAAWSDYNRHKDVSAPGESIYSTKSSKTGYGNLRGTSMAAPIVSGVFALLWAAAPNLTVDQACNAVYATAHHEVVENDELRNGVSGSHGAIDALAALEYVLAGEFSDAQISLSQDSFTYNGQAHEPQVSVLIGNVELKEGVDYTLSYSNNIDVGTATVDIFGIGIYADEGSSFRRVHFGIVQAEIGADDVRGIANRTYTGQAQAQALTVAHDGRTLVEGTDYTLAYANNVDAGMATVRVVGTGNYTGLVEKTFTIAPADIASTSASGVSAKTYTGSAIAQAPVLSLGKSTLLEGVDYTLYSRNNTEVGTATIVATGKGNYRGTKEIEFKIEAASLADATVSGVADQVFTGKPLTPSPVVKMGATTLVEGRDYTLTYANNVNEGTATIVITGAGNYAGAKRVSFRIGGAESSQGDGSGASSSGESGASGGIGGSAASEMGIAKLDWVRVAGDTAYDTMAQVSRRGWAAFNTDTVILATGENFPDALAAAGVAGLEKAPVVITKTSDGTLSEQARHELARLKPSKIVAVGGIYAMPQTVIDAAKEASGAAVALRLWGAKASDTAAAMNNAYRGHWSDTAILATSLNYPDALSAAPLAYAKKMPIYLVDDADSISDATLESMALCGISKVVVVGGRYCVSSAVKAKINATGTMRVLSTLAGDSAYDTSSAIANYGLAQGLTANKMGVACGLNYLDALTGAALCGKNTSVLVLADGKDSETCLGVVRGNRGSISFGYVFGGIYAVPPAVMSLYESTSQ